jgi:hypothetical protein
MEIDMNRKVRIAVGAAIDWCWIIVEVCAVLSVVAVLHGLVAVYG